MKQPIVGLCGITVLLACVSCLSLAEQNTVTQPGSILVSVLDRKGNAVTDLTAKNFRARLKGKPAQVLNATYSLAPRRIVVLMDVSGSMRGVRNSKWQVARDALQDLLDETPQDVPLALLTFSNQVHDVFDFSQSRSSLVAWLRQGMSQRSDVKGTTALRDAIVAAVKMLQPARLGDSIYAITDGEDSASHVSSRETRRALSSSAVRLFAFLFDDSVYLTDEEKRGRDNFLDMARDSGGFVFGVRGGDTRGAARYPPKAFDFEYKDARNEIKSYTRDLNGLVNGFYTIQIGVPQLRKDAKITLEIVDKAGAVRKDIAFTHQNSMPGAK